jgi:putative flippase GtrA
MNHTFDHKTNMYSKPMAITTARTGVSYHTMQIILSIFYMHVSFTSHISILAQRFSQMSKFMCNKYNSESCKICMFSWYTK